MDQLVDSGVLVHVQRPVYGQSRRTEVSKAIRQDAVAHHLSDGAAQLKRRGSLEDWTPDKEVLLAQGRRELLAQLGVSEHVDGVQVPHIVVANAAGDLDGVHLWGHSVSPFTARCPEAWWPRIVDRPVG